MKKNPTELSVDDLLKSLNQTEPIPETEPKLIDSLGDVPSFLMAFGIKAGNDVVVHRLFYELYKLWSIRPVTKGVFSLELGKYLLKHQKGPKVFYLVDKSALSITQEIQKYVLKHSIDKTKNKKYKTHFELFIKENNIKKGSCFYPYYMLYYIYDRWNYSTKKKTQLGERQLFNFCKLYFKHKRRTSNRVEWFALDKDSMDKILPFEKQVRIKKAYLRKHAKKEKQPKKQDKVPRS